MTEAQLRSFPAFQRLPVYDEKDQRADTITTAFTSGPYRRVRECSTLAEVEACLKDARLVALGALRTEPDGDAVVVAYFGERA